MCILNILALLSLGFIVDQTVADGFSREYPQAAATLGAHLSKVRGVAHVSGTGSKARTGQDTRFTFAVDGDFKKFELARVVGRGKDARSIGHVYCLAGSKSFRLKQIGEGSYRIERIGLDPVEQAVSNEIFDKYLDALWAIHGVRLSELIKAPDLRLISAKEVDLERARLVEIEFTSGTFNGQPDWYRVRLDPSLCWSIVESEFRPGSSRVSPEILGIEYPTDRAGGWAFPRRIRSQGLNGKHHICEFERVDLVGTPAGEFGLEHYGLKDVTMYAPGGSSKSYAWLVWPGIIAALLAGSVALKRVAGRMR